MEIGREEAEEGGREWRMRRVDLWGLKHISIHGEEEATDSRETERDQTEQHTHTHTHILVYLSCLWSWMLQGA